VKRSTVPAPVRVMVVDLDGPLPRLDPHRPAGGRYGAALIVATRAGRPLGALELPLTDRPVPEEELRDRLRAVAVAGGPDVAAEPARPDAQLPFATVVIPTAFARSGPLARCVASLSTMDYPNFEILVVDNRVQPDESDWSAICAVPRVRVLAQPCLGASAARNLGARAARGGLIAFTDDDVIVDPGWLRALVGRFLAEPEIDCVTGLVLPAELETPAQVLFERSGGGPQRRYHRATFSTGPEPFTVTDYRSEEPSVGSLYALGPFGAGCNLAVRAAALRDLGGFEEALGPGTPTRAGEDLLLLLRLLSSGRTLGVEPAAVVFHRHRRGDAELRGQMYGYGVGFTAMLTAAVHHDRRHIRGLLGVARPAVGSLGTGVTGRATRRSDPYPWRLSLARLAGLVVGPIAYLVSQRRMRRWR
jgi:GT2 family glycosyltransferase